MMIAQLDVRLSGRASDRPSTIVRSLTAKPKVKRILVPVDGSPYSMGALDCAAMLGKTFAAEIILLHVVESPLFCFSLADRPMVLTHRPDGDVMEKALAEKRSWLEDLARQIRKKEKLAVRPRLTAGLPHREILRASEKVRADLIVLGTHGRTGVEHILLGSVAEKVVRLAACPVLTVRPKLE
jgi:universal stress protein A